MKQILISVLIFAAFGIFTEVVFRAIVNVGEQLYYGQSIDWMLRTKIYFWMIPIYGLSYLLFHFGYRKIKYLPILLQLILITLSIFVIEYATGWLLESIIGTCPWTYNKGWHIDGLIRLDYAPFWMLFAFLLIHLYNTIHKLQLEKI